MKEILQYVQERWVQAGYPEIAGYFAAILAAFGVIQSLWKLGIRVWKLGQQRKLKKDLFPFYTSQEIQRATQYYVETTCQNVAPSKHEEPRRGYAFAAREKIIPFFLKKAFKPEEDDCQFYIVLADSGMGKTTFLMNLYLRYIEQFFEAKYRIKLLPLGFPEIDKEANASSTNSTSLPLTTKTFAPIYGNVLPGFRFAKIGAGIFSGGRGLF